jgi:hypothetical protein
MNTGSGLRLSDGREVGLDPAPWLHLKANQRVRFDYRAIGGIIL